VLLTRVFFKMPFHGVLWGCTHVLCGSPTTLSAIVDAKEQREVAAVDIPNAFVQTDNEKLKSHHEIDIMKAKGSLADMLVEIDPDTHRPHLTKNDKKNGATALHSKILKALHGMIVSSLLFCRKLRKDLEQ